MDGRSVKFDFSGKIWQKSVARVYVMSVIAETISIGITVTNRHVYYCYIDIFCSDKVSGHLISSICCVFRGIESSIAVVPEPKGYIAFSKK